MLMSAALICDRYASICDYECLLVVSSKHTYGTASHLCVTVWVTVRSSSRAYFENKLTCIGRTKITDRSLLLLLITRTGFTYVITPHINLNWLHTLSKKKHMTARLYFLNVTIFLLEVNLLFSLYNFVESLFNREIIA